MMRSQPRWRSAREDTNALFTITDAELQAASKGAQDISDALYEDKHVAAMAMLEAVQKYRLDGKEVARLMQGMAAIGWIMGCHNVDFDTAATSHPLLTKLSLELSTIPCHPAVPSCSEGV
jgi:hypothetical protein